MSEIEFIDLFPGEREPRKYNHFYSDNEFDEYPDIQPDEMETRFTERRKINDYKNTANSTQRVNNAGHNLNNREGDFTDSNEKKPKIGNKAINLTDEKIIWAGALFVFFGVFVFLIGYWLGKTTLLNVRTSNETYLEEIQQKLEERRLENSFSELIVENGNNNNGGISEITPQAITIPSAAADPITAPPVNSNPQAEEEPEQSTIQLTTSQQQVIAAAPAPVVEANIPIPSAEASQYTIQISAHTKMEKARALEDMLRQQGFQPYIVESIVNGVRYYRVRVGNFKNKQTATETLDRLKLIDVGQDSYIISLST